MSSSLVIGNSTSVNILEYSFGDCVYGFLLAIFPEVEKPNTLRFLY